MDPDSIAPMVVLVVLILTAGGVAVLRPVSRQLAEFLQVLTQERLGVNGRRASSGDTEQMRQLVAALESRLALLEERQGFTEALLETGAVSNNGTRTVADRSAQNRRELPTA